MDEGKKGEARIAEQRSKLKRKCKCNSAALQAAINWEISKNIAKTSNAFCGPIIYALAVAHPQILQQDMDTWIASIKDACHIPRSKPILITHIISRCPDPTRI